MSEAGNVIEWVWANKESIWPKLREIWTWFGRGKGTTQQPGILILGTGGSGKTTLARLLSDSDYRPLMELPGEYEESIGIEAFSLKDAPGVEIVVPPGQQQRREFTWGSLHSDLAASRFRGVILLSSYGYNNFMVSYKHHDLYQGNKNKFVAAFCERQREDELEILRQLAPHLAASRGKLWMLTLVAKQDLWWPNRDEVERHYRDAAYRAELLKIAGDRGKREFRHEFAFASLIISNFTSGANELLKPNATGYDQRLQVGSLRRLFETIDALRQWEEAS